MRVILLLAVSTAFVGFFQQGCREANKADLPLATNQNSTTVSISPSPPPETKIRTSNPNIVNDGISAEQAQKNREAEEKAEQEIKELCKNMPVAQVETTPSISNRRTRFAPFTIKFDGSKSYDPNGKKIIKWEWRFGDGETGQGMVIKHTYNRAGLFAASLVVTNSNGESRYVCSASSQNILVADRNR